MRFSKILQSCQSRERSTEAIGTRTLVLLAPMSSPRQATRTTRTRTSKPLSGEQKRFDRRSGHRKEFCLGAFDHSSTRTRTRRPRRREQQRFDRGKVCFSAFVFSSTRFRASRPHLEEQNFDKTPGTEQILLFGGD